MLELPGMTTRRFFVYIPRQGAPVAITHAIEQGPWAGWPAKWRKETYSSWRLLESLLAEVVKGKRIAMEYSPGDAVPYLDRVPAGVLEMGRNVGATDVLYARFLWRFFSGWAGAEGGQQVYGARAVQRNGQEEILVAGSVDWRCSASTRD